MTLAMYLIRSLRSSVSLHRFVHQGLIPSVFRPFVDSLVGTMSIVLWSSSCSCLFAVGWCTADTIDELEIHWFRHSEGLQNSMGLQVHIGCKTACGYKLRQGYATSRFSRQSGVTRKGKFASQQRAKGQSGCK